MNQNRKWTQLISETEPCLRRLLNFRDNWFAQFGQLKQAKQLEIHKLTLVRLKVLMTATTPTHCQQSALSQQSIAPEASWEEWGGGRQHPVRTFSEAKPKENANEITRKTSLTWSKLQEVQARISQLVSTEGKLVCLPVVITTCTYLSKTGPFLKNYLEANLKFNKLKKRVLFRSFELHLFSLAISLSQICLIIYPRSRRDLSVT